MLFFAWKSHWYTRRLQTDFSYLENCILRHNLGCTSYFKECLLLVSVTDRTFIFTIFYLRKRSIFAFRHCAQKNCNNSYI